MDISVDQSGRAEPHQQTADQVLSALDTDADVGLTSAEARSRLDRFGRNELAAEKPVPAWRKFLAQFKDVLVILLLVATAISAALVVLSSASRALPYEAIAIFAVVLLNARDGLHPGSARGSRRWRRFAAMSAAHATVMRDGSAQSIPAAELVPGDIILIEEGDTIPADARADPIRRAADGGGRAHRREPAGVEGHRADRGRGRHRRPAQHGLQRHGGDLRPRARRWSPRRACRPRWAASPAC